MDLIHSTLKYWFLNYALRSYFRIFVFIQFWLKILKYFKLYNKQKPLDTLLAIFKILLFI